jgi:hypothetical protein
VRFGRLVTIAGAVDEAKVMFRKSKNLYVVKYPPEVSFVLKHEQVLAISVRILVCAVVRPRRWMKIVARSEGLRD